MTGKDDVPWYRHRLTEIGKIKAIRKRRQISPDFAMTARYYVRHKQKVTGSWQMPPACQLGQSQPITDLAQR